MKLEDVDEARASWMKLEMICIQLCQGAVSVGCTDKPCIVDSVPDHMVVVAFQKLAAFIPVVVQEPSLLMPSPERHILMLHQGCLGNYSFMTTASFVCFFSERNADCCLFCQASIKEALLTMHLW